MMIRFTLDQSNFSFCLNTLHMMATSLCNRLFRKWYLPLITLVQNNARPQRILPDQARFHQSTVLISPVPKQKKNKFIFTSVPKQIPQITQTLMLKCQIAILSIHHSYIPCSRANSSNNSNTHAQMLNCYFVNPPFLSLVP